MQRHPPNKRPAPNTVGTGPDASAIQGRPGARVALLQSPIPRAAPRACARIGRLSGRKFSGGDHATLTLDSPQRMNLLERNGDRTDPWAFGWPVLKIGLCALLWPDWKRYSVLRTGCTDSRLSQAFCASARPEEAIQNATPVAAELQQMRKRN